MDAAVEQPDDKDDAALLKVLRVVEGGGHSVVVLVGEPGVRLIPLVSAPRVVAHSSAGGPGLHIVAAQRGRAVGVEDGLGVGAELIAVPVTQHEAQIVGGDHAVDGAAEGDFDIPRPVRVAHQIDAVVDIHMAALRDGHIGGEGFAAHGAGHIHRHAGGADLHPIHRLVDVISRQKDIHIQHRRGAGGGGLGVHRDVAGQLYGLGKTELIVGKVRHERQLVAIRNGTGTEGVGDSGVGVCLAVDDNREDLGGHKGAIGTVSVQPQPRHLVVRALVQFDVAGENQRVVNGFELLGAGKGGVGQRQVDRAVGVAGAHRLIGQLDDGVVRDCDACLMRHEIELQCLIPGQVAGVDGGRQQDEVPNAFVARAVLGDGVITAICRLKLTVPPCVGVPILLMPPALQMNSARALVVQVEQYAAPQVEGQVGRAGEAVLFPLDARVAAHKGAGRAGELQRAAGFDQIAQLGVVPVVPQAELSGAAEQRGQIRGVDTPRCSARFSLQGNGGVQRVRIGGKVGILVCQLARDHYGHIALLRAVDAQRYSIGIAGDFDGFVGQGVAARVGHIDSARHAVVQLHRAGVVCSHHGVGGVGPSAEVLVEAQLGVGEVGESRSLGCRRQLDGDGLALVLGVAEGNGSAAGVLRRLICSAAHARAAEGRRGQIVLFQRVVLAVAAGGSVEGELRFSRHDGTRLVGSAAGAFLKPGPDVGVLAIAVADRRQLDQHIVPFSCERETLPIFKRQRAAVLRQHRFGAAGIGDEPHIGHRFSRIAVAHYLQALEVLRQRAAPQVGVISFGILCPQIDIGAYRVGVDVIELKPERVDDRSACFGDGEDLFGIENCFI